MMVTETQCDTCYTTTQCFILGGTDVVVLALCLQCYPCALDILTKKNQFPLCTVCLSCTSWNSAKRFDPVVCERCKSGLNKKGSRYVPYTLSVINPDLDCEGCRRGVCGCEEGYNPDEDFCDCEDCRIIDTGDWDDVPF